MVRTVAWRRESAWRAITLKAMDDPYGLERFVSAQDAGGTYQQAAAELRAGLKVSHWMWFIFPQIAGLGFSAISRRYAISSLAEATAYLAHPVLGPRLVECAQIVAGAEGRSAAEIFGSIDAVKLRSSMTLFMTAAPDEPVFREVLEKYFGGNPDDATLERLALPGLFTLFVRDIPGISGYISGRTRPKGVKRQRQELV
jgi:uncharacterized protein (DUF1810 family)